MNDLRARWLLTSAKKQVPLKMVSWVGVFKVEALQPGVPVPKRTSSAKAPSTNAAVELNLSFPAFSFPIPVVVVVVNVVVAPPPFSFLSF